MKSLGHDILLSVLMGLVLPGMILNYGVFLREQVQAPEPEEEILPQQKIALEVLVRDEADKVTSMDMDDYLVGVVLAEMPVSFAEEALKAQSVVARTYAQKACSTSGKHGDGSVCVRSSCCQGYVPEENYLAAGGSREGVDRVKEAVMATSGQVLCYGEELIEATYFSCSGGSTEDAVAVWGTDYPYLQAVDSPGEENAAYYMDTVTFPPEELEEKLDTELSGDPQKWISGVLYTDGGGVDTIAIGGKYFRGTEVRSALGLRSTAFEITAREDGVTFTTRGYGHRVGMSQYGADAMAVSGKNYADILAHYYPGTELVMVSD